MNKEKLIMLYNTLCLIDTKGVNTRYMADCLKFIEDALEEMNDEDETLGCTNAPNDSVQPA